MKTKMKIPVILIIAILFALISCKKDEKEIKNHLKYDGKTYDLAKGVLMYFGTWSSIAPNYNFDLLLVSSGINIDQETGQGNFIFFEMFTSSSQFSAGTYNYNWSGGASTFDEGYFGLNGTLDPWSFQFEDEIEGGSVKVQVSGSTYTININCTDPYGKKITGYYKGTLGYRDYSDWKKSTGEKPDWKTLFN